MIFTVEVPRIVARTIDKKILEFSKVRKRSLQAPKLKLLFFDH
jgi:hypothetical protein